MTNKTNETNTDNIVPGGKYVSKQSPGGPAITVGGFGKTPNGVDVVYIYTSQGALTSLLLEFFKEAYKEAYTFEPPEIGQIVIGNYTGNRYQVAAIGKDLDGRPVVIAYALSSDGGIQPFLLDVFWECVRAAP